MLIILISFTCKAKNINVVTEYLAPYQINNADGSIGGSSTKIIRALFALTNDEYKITMMPWARAYYTAQTVKNTLIYSMSRTKSRENLFKWVGAIKNEKIFIWAMKSEHFNEIKRIKDLNNYSIGIVRSSYAENFLKFHYFKKAHLLVNDDQSIKMLFNHRVDLIIGDEITFLPRIKKLGLDSSKMTKVIAVPELSVNLSIAFNLNSDPELVKRYQQAYLQLKKSGQLTELLRAKD